jgi:hypothetical protein
MKICPYCKLEFDIHGRNFGGHVTNCKLNLNKFLKNLKIKEKNYN